MEPRRILSTSSTRFSYKRPQSKVYGSQSERLCFRLSTVDFRLSLSELFEKPEIVLEEELDVTNVVLHQGEPIDAEPERPTGIPVWVDPAVPQHFRVDHAATHDFNPSA